MDPISQRVRSVITSLPPHVTLLVAAKGQSADAVRAALQGGAGTIGHNYVQEAEAMIGAVGPGAAHWSMIGHLQRNKASTAVRLFDSVQSVDSLRLAETLDRHCRRLPRVLPILLEVNVAREPQKSGVLPEDVVELAREIARLRSLRIEGLMTLGPQVQNAEALRPAFRAMRDLLQALRVACSSEAPPHILSMGMSDSYPVALEEGATMIRLGSLLFGPRATAPEGD